MVKGSVRELLKSSKTLEMYMIYNLSGYAVDEITSRNQKILIAYSHTNEKVDIFLNIFSFSSYSKQEANGSKKLISDLVCLY